MGYSVEPAFYDDWFRFPFRALDFELARAPLLTDGRRGVTATPRYTYRISSSAAYLEVELPGVAREHVQVEVEGSKLIVRGKRFRNERGSCCVEERESDGKKEPVVMQRYRLALRLGKDADADGVKADHCGNGVLVVTIPIKEREVRKIEVA